MTAIEVIFTPLEQETLSTRDLSNTLCVIFDILRATSTMVVALANGAAAIVPVAEISEAVALRKKDPVVLLAGERDGSRISAALSGGIEFDLGNSPREFTSDIVTGKTIVSTTTNGTRALRACKNAGCVLIGSFLNLEVTADFVVAKKPERILLVCAGTGKLAALEDTLAAGAFCDVLVSRKPDVQFSDSAHIARLAHAAARGDLPETFSSSANAQRLLAIPTLRDDVEFCLRANTHPLVAGMDSEGKIKIVSRG